MKWMLTRSRMSLAVLALAVAPLLLFGLSACQTEKPDSPSVSKLPEAAQGPEYFEEVTAKSPGLKTFVCRNGEDKNHYAILETLGGGVAAIDFDGDGLLDLVLIGGGDFAGPDKKKIIGYPTRVFKNMGNFVFKDVTEETLPEQTLFYSHGVAVADYDRDGWPDLLVTGYGGIALYRNVDAGGGKRKFVEVTKQVGLHKTEHFWATSAAFADLDGDGWPDLYICQYLDWSWDNHPLCPGRSDHVKRDVCNPEMFNANQHALYRNDGKGKFIDVTTESGLRIEAADPGKEKPVKRKYCGSGLGVLITDVDGDGRPDIYVANDGTGNFLYLNKSKPGQIKLVESAKNLGVALDLNQNANGSMGVDAADIDGSGDPALWITNFDGQLHALHRMAGNKAKNFFHATLAAGLGIIGKSYVGWGTGFADLDNDGWMDLVITNGHVFRHPPNNNLAQKAVLFRNKGSGEGKFQVITEQGGPYFKVAHRGRGLAIADLNNDGYPDLVFSNLNEPPAVLKNICPAKNHWLGVSLLGRDHADTVGAKAVLTVGKHKLTLFQKGGGSYLSVRDPRLLFGLGENKKIGTLTVSWPSGEPRLEHFPCLAIDRYHEIKQGKGKAG